MGENNSEILQLIYGQIQLLRAELQLKMDVHTEHMNRLDVDYNKLDLRLGIAEDKCKLCPGKIALEKLTTQDSKEWKIGNFLITVGSVTLIVLSILGLIHYFTK